MIDLSFINSNPIAQGGLLTVVVGAALAALRSVPGRLWGFVSTHAVLTLSVDGDDSSFKALLYWLSKQPAARRGRHLRILSVHKHEYTSETDTYLTLGEGSYMLRFHGSVLWITYSRSRNDRGTLNQEVSVRLLGRNRELLQQLLEESREVFVARLTKDEVEVYLHQQNNWRVGQTVKKRPLDSIILPAGQLEDLVADVDHFLTQRSWYERTGVPYRRGYLLHGPPGNGKTSLCLALAGHFQKSVYVLNLGGMDMTDTNLLGLLQEVPSGSVVCLEDIDAVFTKRSPDSETDKKDPLLGLSLSGLLNALDGAAAGTDRLVFMTTNHPERLDPALIRPGRADRHLLIDNASPEQGRRLFLRFFPAAPKQAEQFRKSLAEDGGAHSMASLQEHLLTHKNDPGRAAQWTALERAA